MVMVMMMTMATTLRMIANDFDRGESCGRWMGAPIKKRKEEEEEEGEKGEDVE